MSQHCLCGGRVPKTLVQRIHHCPHCGLRGNRDTISAALAACVNLTDLATVKIPMSGRLSPS
jgi:transposase